MRGNIGLLGKINTNENGVTIRDQSVFKTNLITGVAILNDYV